MGRSRVAVTDRTRFVWKSPRISGASVRVRPVTFGGRVMAPWRNW